LKEKVDSIDRLEKCIATDRDDKYFYDKLVFSTGAKPFVPPIEGLKGNPDILTYHNFLDVVKIKQAANTAKRVAIIAGGLLELEAVRFLIALCQFSSACGSSSVEEKKEEIPLHKQKVTDSELEKGRQIWLGTCKTCHLNGVSGVPRLGNKKEWQPRVKKEWIFCTSML
jgi:hypothetical protein